MRAIFYQYLKERSSLFAVDGGMGLVVHSGFECFVKFLEEFAGYILAGGSDLRDELGLRDAEEMRELRDFDGVVGFEREPELREAPCGCPRLVVHAPERRQGE